MELSMDLKEFVNGKIGHFLKDARLKAQFTVVDVASINGMTPEIVEAIENGCTIPLCQFAKLADTYGIWNEAMKFLIKLQHEIGELKK